MTMELKNFLDRNLPHLRLTEENEWIIVYNMLATCVIWTKDDKFVYCGKKDLFDLMDKMNDFNLSFDDYNSKELTISQEVFSAFITALSVLPDVRLITNRTIADFIKDENLQPSIVPALIIGKLKTSIQQYVDKRFKEADELAAKILTEDFGIEFKDYKKEAQELENDGQDIKLQSVN